MEELHTYAVGKEGIVVHNLSVPAACKLEEDKDDSKTKTKKKRRCKRRTKGGDDNGGELSANVKRLMKRCRNLAKDCDDRDVLETCRKAVVRAKKVNRVDDEDWADCPTCCPDNTSVPQIVVAGRRAIQKQGCCIEAVLNTNLSAGWQLRVSQKFSQWGLGVVYVMLQNGKIMKVGKSETQLTRGRWSKYVYAHNNCGGVQMIAWAFAMSCAPSVESVEKAVRGVLCGPAPECPWDNTPQQRLGRSGPGVPGEGGERDDGHWDGCVWKPGPGAKQPRQSKKPSDIELERLLKFHNYNNSAVARALGVSEGSIRNWRGI